MSKFYKGQWVQVLEKWETFNAEEIINVTSIDKHKIWLGKRGWLEKCDIKPLAYQVGDTITWGSQAFHCVVKDITKEHVYCGTSYIPHDRLVLNFKLIKSAKETTTKVDRDWVIGPFESLEQVEQVWQRLRACGEKMCRSDFRYEDTVNSLAWVKWMSSSWYESVRSPNISPTEVLEKLGHSSNKDLVEVTGILLNIPTTHEPVGVDSVGCSSLCKHIFRDGHQEGCHYYKPQPVTPNVWGISQPKLEPDYLTLSDKKGK